MASDSIRAFSALPIKANSERLQRRALSRGVSRTTAVVLHNAPGWAFFASCSEAIAGRTDAHVARLGVSQ